MCQEFLVDMKSKYRDFLNVIYVVDDKESAIPRAKYFTE